MDLNLGFKRISYGLFRVAHFCCSLTLDRSSCYCACVKEAVSFQFLLGAIELCRSTKISNTKKLITYSFETPIEIRLNWYLKDIISQLLEGFSDRETLSLCSWNFVTKFSLFHQTKEFQSRSEDSIGEEAKVITTTTDLVL